MLKIDFKIESFPRLNTYTSLSIYNVFRMTMNHNIITIIAVAQDDLEVLMAQMPRRHVSMTTMEWDQEILESPLGVLEPPPIITRYPSFFVRGLNVCSDLVFWNLQLTCEHVTYFNRTNNNNSNNNSNEYCWSKEGF
jgi:hypothetical protein